MITRARVRGVINSRNYLGDFARYFGVRNAATGNAKHARAWLATTNAGRSWMFNALGGTGSAADFADLPLDYYAPGANVFDMRTAHDANAMQVHLQLGTPGGTEHRHNDAGSFQVWRKGRFLTRETAGYSDQIAGFMGTGKSSVGRLVAEQLRFAFLDTDHVIEARAGQPITEIFSAQGEAAFREMERKVVAEVATREA